MMDYGSRIKQRREEIGMSQDELAKRLGYKSRSSINKIEKDGRNLPQDKILKIANILDTTPSFIMGWELPSLDNLLGEISKSDNEIDIAFLEVYVTLSDNQKKLLKNIAMEMKKE